MEGRFGCGCAPARRKATGFSLNKTQTCSAAVLAASSEEAAACLPSYAMRRLSACWLLQMVFSSSCTVYGNPSRVPIDETHPLAAVSPYGRSKLIIEEIFRDYSAADSQWRTILLRYFNPVGAHPSGPALALPAQIRVSLSGTLAPCF